MDKMERRNRRQNKLIFIISSILSLLLLVANIYFIYSNNTLNSKIKESNKNSVTLKNIYDNNLDEAKRIEEEIKLIQNIKSNIEQARSDYYKTLKVFEDKVSNKEINYKIAYLTFDDGPYHLTDEFLKVLEKYDVRATFFTIGLDKDWCFDNRNYSCKETYAKTASYGHTMANHTYSHLIFNGLYSSADSFINQVKKQETLIKERTGLTTNIVRFPGGSATAGYLKNNIMEKLRQMNYGWVDWTASNGDGGWVGDKYTALSNLKSTINEDIEVVLFHDYSYATLAALPEVIEYLRNNNYVLLPLFYESKMVQK